MDIKAERDLLLDEYGNYYIVSYASGNSMTIVNAALYYAFNQMINDEFVAQVNEQYPNEIACGKFFADLVEQHLEEINQPDNDGKVYPIEEVRKEYDLHVKPIYGDSFHM